MDFEDCEFLAEDAPLTVSSLGIFQMFLKVSSDPDQNTCNSIRILPRNLMKLDSFCFKKP